MQHPALHPSYRLSHLLGPHGSHAERRRLMLFAAMAGIAALALLALFQSVVRESVRQGQLRHEATARHSAATWQCTGQRSLRLRDLCLAELNAPPPQVTLITSP